MSAHPVTSFSGAELSPPTVTQVRAASVAILVDQELRDQGRPELAARDELGANGFQRDGG
jgi:hypothetical protein